MEIANGTIILSPENHQYRYGVTPAEALLLKEMHFKHSNGSPLGADFVIQTGEAQTVDEPGKPGEEAYFDQVRGEHVKPKPPVPARTHKRTNAEEADRLRRKYTGNITRNGVSMPAFVAVFGSATKVQLPETFAEIEEDVGIQFHRGTVPGHNDERLRQLELAPFSRHELVEIALGLKLKIAPADSKDFIIAAIINEERKLAEAAPVGDETPTRAPDQTPADEPGAPAKAKKGK